jgi:transposase
VNKSTGVRCDQTGELIGFYSLKGYPEKLRRIKFYDQEQKRTFVFLTNNLHLSPEEIASLYKHRWKIELFFKWIKQHLKIKSFWGTTENAVKTQVYIAVITYTLVAIIRQKLKTAYTNYEVLQILGSSLLDKTPLNQLLRKTSDQDVKELLCNQLKIF